jgi:hypothetical protein
MRNLSWKDKNKVYSLKGIYRAIRVKENATGNDTNDPIVCVMQRSPRATLGIFESKDVVVFINISTAIDKKRSKYYKEELLQGGTIRRRNQ